MLRTIGFLIATVLALSGAETVMSAESSKVKPKPQLPLQLEILAKDPAMNAASLRPGDAVEYRVIAVAHADADEMRITIELQDGVELVSGPLAWAGPVKKKGMKELPVAVRLPAGGRGAIMATVTMMRSGSVVARRTTQQQLGPGTTVERSKTSRPVKKDSKGRNIVEY